MKLKVAVIVRDDSIHVDYAGTSDQVADAVNQLPHELPLRPHRLRAEMPARSRHAEQRGLHRADHRRGAARARILNPQPWAAGNSRNLIGHVIPSLIFKALEGVVPDKVQGDSGGAPIWAVNCVGQHDDGSQYGAVQNFHGGQGGRAELDGLDTLSFPSNCKVTAVEMFEIAVPVLTECKELIPDSGGAGKHRGGLGQRAVFRNLGKRR